MAARTQTKVLTAIVGSYPKPRYVYRQNGRSLLDSFGFAFDRRRQELGPPEFSRLLDRAALEAIKDQNRAGIDIVTDGEERRGHYVLHIVNRLEVSALIAAGCQVIQFDDPVLLRYPEAAQDWGLQALERCFAGLEDRAMFFVHICRGYPNKPLERQGISYKANQDYYRDILSWLSESRLDVVSIEGAASKLDVSILSAVGKKSVMLGVIDVGENDVEDVEPLVRRANDALRYLPKGQLILAPD